MTKAELRQQLRAARREHERGVPDAVRGLLFHRPPRAIVDRLPAGATIGLYRETDGEAPARGYARWLHEAGHPVALPWFADRASPMRFRRWHDPLSHEALAAGPLAIEQPDDDATEMEPDVLFVPLVGFTAHGARLGMGGGHYDRWLARHPGALAIGLAWDCQEVDRLPTEQHDRALDAIVTPTRLFGPFERANAT